MAATEPSQGEPAAAHNAVKRDGFNGVGRTGRNKAAAAWKQGRNGNLVQADRQYEQLFNQRHRQPPAEDERSL